MKRRAALWVVRFSLDFFGESSMIRPMMGLLIGSVCGAAEFLLLRAFVNKITANMPVPFWMIPLKIILLAVFFIPCALLWPSQLLHAGIAAACVLIGGAAVQFVCKQVKQKKNKGDKPLADQSQTGAETAD